MKFGRKAAEIIARNAYPKGLRGECRNAECPSYLKGREASQDEYIKWVVTETWPTCKKCQSRIEVEAVR